MTTPPVVGARVNGDGDGDGDGELGVKVSGLRLDERFDLFLLGGEFGCVGCAILDLLLGEGTGVGCVPLLLSTGMQVRSSPLELRFDSEFFFFIRPRPIPFPELLLPLPHDEFFEEDPFVFGSLYRSETLSSQPSMGFALPFDDLLGTPDSGRPY